MSTLEPGSAPKAVPEGAAPQRSPKEVEELCAILRFAVGRACPGDLAGEREDLVQSALMRVLEVERRGETGPVRSTSYLLQVAYTTIADAVRRLRRRRAVSVGEDERPDAAPVLRVSGPVPRPQLALAIRECAKELAEARRAVLILRLQGFSLEEAARALGLRRKRVQNLTFRGLSDLRRCLREKGETL